MQGDHDEKRGVVNERAEFFDSFSAETHGIGRRHDPATCGVPACAHSDHGLSTSGDNFKERERAGQRYDGHGKRDPEIGAHAYNPNIAAGGERAIEEIDHDPEACMIEGCRSCNRVDEASMQPGYTIVKGGGSSSRKKKSSRGGAAIPPYIMASYPHPDKAKETEEERAKRLARENEQRIEQSTSRPGRKVQGKEKRMHVQGTLEPTKVAHLNEMTGKTCIELLENVHEILALAKSGAEGGAVLDAVMGLLAKNGVSEDGKAAA